MSTTINEPTVPTGLDSPRVAGLRLAVQMPFIAVNVNGNPQTNATEFTQGVLQGNGFLIFNTEEDQYALRPASKPTHDRCCAVVGGLKPDAQTGPYESKPTEPHQRA